MEALNYPKAHTYPFNDVKAILNIIIIILINPKNGILLKVNKHLKNI